jgi:cell division protein FtsN
MQEKNSRQLRREKRRSEPLPGWVWFAGGLLLGALVMGIVWVKDYQVNSQVAEAQLKNAQTEQAVTAPQKAADEKKQSKLPQRPEVVRPQFEFYSVLPDMEVEVEPDSLRPAASKPAAAAPAETVTQIPADKIPETVVKPLKTDAKSLFQMQLASFRSRTDAERMMASSALKGITTRIEKVTINDKAYYRVRSGPYSREQAYSLHKRLKKSGIESLIMRVKK